MRIASIDIGTNTLFLLIADVDGDGKIEPVEEVQRMPRLGKDVDVNNKIAVSAFDRVAWIINEYKNLSKQLGAQTVVACATSAVRDASNREDFLRHMKSATGIEVEVLGGTDEALWTYRGAVSGFPTTSLPRAVVDIGGGSTEVTFPPPEAHNGNSQLRRYSFQMGSVRVTERFLKHHPPIGEELQSAARFVTEELAQVRNPGFHQYQLVAVAGTATTLACLDQQLTEFEVSKVSRYELDRHRVNLWYSRLSRMTSQDIRALSGATEGREDILTGGVLILSEFMNLFQFQSVIVSERGLRYGLVLREWEREVRSEK